MSVVTTTPTLTDQPSSVHSARPSFVGLVRGELFKLVRQWTPWIALVLMSGIIVLPYLLIFTDSSMKALINSSDYSYFYNRAPIGFALLRAFGGISVLIVTARVIGQEYSLGTIRIILARGVGRVQLLLAKMVTLAVWAIFTMLVGLVVIALLVVAQVQLVGGSLHILTSLPASVWHDLGTYVLTIALNMGVTILMATAVSVAFRSLAGALSASISWFPIDNALVLMMLLMSKLTGSTFWLNVTAYLLGPNLNTMAGVLTTQHSSVWSFGFGPEVVVDSTHTLVVALVYSIIFAVIAIVVTWKRDVKE